ncbi:GPI mannosyltransferase 1-like [Gigantopelta aegis]|uniref:GPI mannosyltransferase 1-like n=1 Tax=Gigantopelta aegis TaxID=1735272 RepID=UPI001B888730|nr:GPI mannosyltransferase 1-like [Gigantopelta aegis]
MLKYYLIATLARLGLIGYGQWQDSTMAVKFTDVDYYVFTDATAFVAQGKSPYERSTYRYTPLLAYILLPNMWTPVFGKLLFVFFDILTGILINRLLHSTGCSAKMAAICSNLWLLNPLTMTVSCRGNAESLMSFLVILTLLMLHHQQTFVAAVTYAIAVHFKIYPVVYALPIYLLLGRGGGTKVDPQKNLNSIFSKFLLQLLPNRNRGVFLAVGVAIVGGLTSLFYSWYGWKFLFETYLYHVVRRDVRHNFSPYFYMLYLSGESETSLPVKVLGFLPQILLLLIISCKFYRDPSFCWFLNTFAFVAANKVCTTQYFLWYLCLLPLVVPRIKMNLGRAIFLTSLWFLSQGLWLLPAYYLEFQGLNTFLFIWMAGLVFFVVNMYIMYSLIVCYKPEDQPFVQLKYIESGQRTCY